VSGPESGTGDFRLGSEESALSSYSVGVGDPRRGVEQAEVHLRVVGLLSAGKGKRRHW